LRVLVTGGTGRLGRSVVARLVDAGQDVHVLARRQRDTQPHVTFFTGDLRRGEGWDRDLSGTGRDDGLPHGRRRGRNRRDERSRFSAVGHGRSCHSKRQEHTRHRSQARAHAPLGVRARRLIEVALPRGLVLWPNAGHADGPNGHLVMVAPPYTITETEIDDLVSLLRDSIADVARELTAPATAAVR